MKQIALGPFTKAAGTVRLPGSKSLSNRALLLAALAEGTTLLNNLLESDDTQVMLAALRTLGVDWQSDIAADGLTKTYRVKGTGGAFPVREADIFVGNAGTVVRPLCAALALNGGHYRVSGVPRMHERPIGDLVDTLRSIGAHITYTGNEGYPPLSIEPPTAVTLDPAIPLRIRGDVSSQFLTAMLMALPCMQGNGEAVIEIDGELISKPYIDITIALMARFGVQVRRDEWRRFYVPLGRKYQSPGTIMIEGDASSASYFLAAGAIGGGPIRVEGVGSASVQGDIAFADALQQMGANVTQGDHWIEVHGITSPDNRLLPFDMDFNLIPDAAMTAAVAALFASGPCTLRNIGSWRVKETDRIEAMATELRKLGAPVEAGPDFLRVTPPYVLNSEVAIDTYDDHRMAMCFSLVSLAGVSVTINDPDCVAKTFPDYFDKFAEVTTKPK
jgi:3-phosphoshikimate 1-carboxyvinyltransferase